MSINIFKKYQNTILIDYAKRLIIILQLNLFSFLFVYYAKLKKKTMIEKKAIKNYS